MFCSKCGAQVNEGTSFCPNCGNRLQAEVTTEKEPQSMYDGETKICARCKKPSPVNTTKCDVCGQKFGTVVAEKQGKLKLLFMTCPGCGEVYEVRKNKAIIAILCGLGGLLTLIGFLPGIAMLIIGILHACGKFESWMIKRCHNCHMTPMQIAMEKRRKSLPESEKKKKERKENAFTSFISQVNQKIGPYNFFKFIPIASYVLFVIAFFMPGDLRSEYRNKDGMTFGDILLNFASELLIISIIIVALYYVSIIPGMFKNIKAKLVSVIASVIIAVNQMVIGIASFGFSSFEFGKYSELFGETITYEASYTIGITPFIIIFSALLLVASSLFNYWIGVEREYLESLT